MTTNGSYMFVEMANERRYSFNAHTYFNNRLVFALTLLSPFRKRREKEDFTHPISAISGLGTVFGMGSTRSFAPSYHQC